MKTILLLITILIFGCGPKYYVPNSQNIPNMTTKGQTNLGIAYNESEYTNGFEVQTAHAITNHIALQFNGDWVRNGKGGYFGEADDEYKATGHIVEIGAGYFNKIASNFVFETYGLLSFGKVELESTTSSSGSNHFSANFNRLGIQPSISYNRKYFSYSISSRLAHLKYKNINGSNNSTDFDTSYLKANNAFWLLEPALTIGAGTKNLKLQLQYVYSLNLTDSSFPQEKDIFSLGLKININPTKTTKVTQEKTSFKTSSDFGLLKPSK